MGKPAHMKHRKQILQILLSDGLILCSKETILEFLRKSVNFIKVAFCRVRKTSLVCCLFIKVS